MTKHPSSFRLRPLLLALLGFLTMTGCGPSNPRLPISGVVTWKGQPLEQGAITFMTASGPMCGALIVEGKFEVSAAQGLEPGSYRVSISSAKGIAPQTPQEREGGASPRAMERLPAKYSSSVDTELKAEVVASGPNRFEWELK